MNSCGQIFFGRISHDLRTPLCSISGNADMLLGNSDRLDEATKHQIYSDIYDDSEWLIGVVENLLSITRLNDGRLKFKFTDQLLDEVIAESLSISAGNMMIIKL